MVHSRGATSFVRAKRLKFCLGLLAPIATLWACTGDDDVFRRRDGGAPEPSTTVDQAVPSDASDGGVVPLACGDASGAPPRVLLVQGNPIVSELAVVNMETKAVDGRLTFDGGYGATSGTGTDPYLLGGQSDLVIRLDAREPWKSVASWDVHGDDDVDGGDVNANPVVVVQTACNKAYVLRYNRDRIAIIDPSRPEGGQPTGYIDLTALKQLGDPNQVEMTSAVYVASKKRMYVLLGNIDFTKFVTEGGGKLVCADLKPSIVAIDVETDQVVSLGGTAPGGGIALEGYNPPLGSPLIYDATLDRLLVLEGGCHEDLGDGGVGEMTRRRVEQVDLASGSVTTLLSLDDRGFPSTLAFASPEAAALAFYFDGYHWDPRESTLGGEIEGGVDLVASDRGAFVGTRQVYNPDFTTGPLQVVSIPLGDAGPSVVVENPFSKVGGYVAGVEAWPHR
ncbi:MAG TPA: hypothetical protein VM580_08990 [Labilithrix sp.]|jgi:hypothetical protein|nr:hypothetical protein [Labilithrix sp.]